MTLVDLMLNENSDIALDGRGDLSLTTGLGAASQYVYLRLLTPLGTLRYDRGFGSHLDELRGKTTFTRDRLTQLATLYVMSALKGCRYVKEIVTIDPSFNSSGYLVIRIVLLLYTSMSQSVYEQTTLQVTVVS